MGGEVAGIAHFWAQADGVSRATAWALLAMSLISWFVILWKGWQWWRARRTARALETFWAAPALEAGTALLRAADPEALFTPVARAALQASAPAARGSLASELAPAEAVERALRLAVEGSVRRLDAGLTWLASIGSTAPFVGLFGTVWGVYHALVGIGLSGQGTLDKVAGPVGEALLMTGAGLAVAIPAVLAYNAFVRSNRVVLARLDAFAHDVFAFLTTGAHVAREEGSGPRRPNIVPVAQGGR
jgi:biopolymer transport protein ExbB